METKYINIKTDYATETLDEIRREEFKTNRDYIKEYKRLLNEYRLNGLNAWLSIRPCKNWSE
jgi:hypothetical protein